MLCCMTHSEWTGRMFGLNTNNGSIEICLSLFCTDTNTQNMNDILVRWFFWTGQHQWIYWVKWYCVFFGCFLIGLVFGAFWIDKPTLTIAFEWRSPVWIRQIHVSICVCYRHKTFATPLWCSIWVVFFLSIPLGVVFFFVRALCVLASLWMWSI